MKRARDLSITECAERHGITRQAIHTAIQEGRLKAHKVGRQWVIRAADCEAYQPRQQPHADQARTTGEA